MPRFTEKEIETMWSMYMDYQTYNEIGKQVRRSKVSVQQKIRSMNWPKREQGLIERIKRHGRAILQHGQTSADIEEYLYADALKAQTEKALAFEQFKEDVKTKPRDACILKAHAKGVPANKMALHLGLSRQRVSELIRGRK